MSDEEEAMIKTIRLYHTTTVDRADSIMAEGFRDNATERKRMFSPTIQYTPRVWFGDIPALDDELFDGIGLFDFDAEKQTFIAVDVPPSVIGKNIKASSVDSTWPGVQFWESAVVWNRFPRTRLELNDIIRLRVTLAMTDNMASRHSGRIHHLRGWVEADRGYKMEFVERVRRILNEFPVAPARPQRATG
jgi:hypothetical protein